MNAAAESVEEEAPGPSPYDVFETDPDLEKNGVWLDFEGGFRLKCRPAGEDNPDFVRVYNELIDPVREAINLGILPDQDEVERRFLIRAYSETVILDADGNFVDRKGKAIPKTPKGYAKLLNDLPRLFRVLRRQTLAIATYRVEHDKTVGKG